jgi:ACS family tartrate transporter-like MFS transporter
MISEIERTTIRKVWWHSVPLLMICLLFNYLDKVNLSFAALTMNQELGFTNTTFGAGAGFFAIGYALSAIPSTLLLHRLGARRWMSIMMVAWGLCSASTAFVTTPQQLLTVRLLLGMAEAGFTPGAILYFTYWFPSDYRGRVLGLFLLILPLGLIVGGPAASGLLALNGWHGLSGWQWLFLIEALPTLVLALAVLFWLTDRPSNAGWLSDAEKSWLNARLDSEQRRVTATTSWSAFTLPKTWMLAAANLTVGTAGIGAIIFLPLIVKSIGFSVTATGWIVAVPGVLAGLTLPLWGFWADRARNRESVVAAACCFIALGLVGAAALLPSPWAIAALSVAMIGFNGSLVAFWVLPSTYLVGASAAAGIAFINIVGNLGTFTGPYLLGWLADQTHSHAIGLTCLAIIAAVSASIMAAQVKVRRTDPVPS